MLKNLLQHQFDTNTQNPAKILGDRRINFEPPRLSAPVVSILYIFLEFFAKKLCNRFYFLSKYVLTVIYIPFFWKKYIIKFYYVYLKIIFE